MCIRDRSYHAPNQLLGTGGLSHLRVVFSYFSFHRLIRQWVLLQQQLFRRAWHTPHGPSQHNMICTWSEKTTLYFCIISLQKSYQVQVFNPNLRRLLYSVRITSYFSLSKHLSCCCSCRSLSYPVLWHDIAVSTPFTAQRCIIVVLRSISVSRFVTTELVSFQYLSTDTGCARNGICWM